MSKTNDRCAWCGALVTTVVRTAGGAWRVCDDHVDRVPNPVRVSRILGRVSLIPKKKVSVR